jgi:hypothetical protein
VADAHHQLTAAFRCGRLLIERVVEPIPEPEGWQIRHQASVSWCPHGDVRPYAGGTEGTHDSASGGWLSATKGPVPVHVPHDSSTLAGAQREVSVMTPATRSRLRAPSPAEFATELRAVIVDLPRFATAPLYRPWHQRWGATSEELAASMVGDDLITGAQYRATRAVTIDAPPGAVWPWLVQVGCLRAGWYADDLLDNLAQPSAEVIEPELQHLEVGQWVPMAPTPSEKTAFKVAGYEPGRWLLWQQPVSSWAWQLAALPGDGTRLVTRLRIRYDWHRPADAVLSLVLNEFGDFPMMRRMLLGIKRRAETQAQPAA